MVASATVYRIFFGSPDGLEVERELFRKLIADYNKTEAFERGVVFVPVLWEEMAGGRGRPQTIINDEIRRCDYFMFAFWDRWGSPPDREGEGRYSSGTEEEFYFAEECCRSAEHPKPDVVVFFKNVPPDRIANPDSQLARVLEFKKRIESDRRLLYKSFDDCKDFRSHLWLHLAKWLRKHENRSQKDKSVDQSGILAPTTPAPKPLGGLVASANLGSCEEAVQKARKLVEEGHLTEAEEVLAKAAVGGNDIEALNEYGRFLGQFGRLASARAIFERVLEMADTSGDQLWRGIAYNNVAVIHEMKGDLPKAEAFYSRVLEIYPLAGRPDKVADVFNNLGRIYHSRANFTEAERLFREALRIATSHERWSSMAAAYNGLGLVQRERGEFGEAERLHRQSLECSEKIPSQEGIARSLCNLGIVMADRGNWDEAEKMQRDALQISQKVGDLRGVAVVYRHLGLLQLERGDFDGAEKLITKALEIHEEMGAAESMSSEYGNLALIYEKKNLIAEAIRLLTKSIAIAEELGFVGSAASGYCNLGSFLTRCGRLDDAEELVRFGLKIHESLQQPARIAVAYTQLGGICEQRKDAAGARDYWTKALNLYTDLGMAHRAKDVLEWLSGLPPIPDSSSNPQSD